MLEAADNTDDDDDDDGDDESSLSDGSRSRSSSPTAHLWGPAHTTYTAFDADAEGEGRAFRPVAPAFPSPHLSPARPGVRRPTPGRRWSEKPPDVWLSLWDLARLGRAAAESAPAGAVGDGVGERYGWMGRGR